MSEKVVQEQTQEQQEQEQTQQQEQQEQQVDMKTYLELVEKISKMEQTLANEAEKAQKIAEKEQELFQKQVQLTLKENGLDKFADIVKVSNENELADVVKKLQNIVNEIRIESGYVPADHVKTDEYSVYEKKKDVAGMIATKISKLFQ
ncbi:FKBP-type peptidyl-prolyl cis-trans isomerase [Anoxybacillus voinovskiensis]|uniref:FKBP-type peptidyl-prolyl cis-trans isomerase n=1 Tax=Anoxybacteroides voinovskiense TaxID=230470 RepID=A0A840DU55_9BACL|nr:hypothetical protein [Anoxybacillus voinovskiensis]MBB4075203.1 FKBP-type peptidyl-prolyl cis-trans isomerase [Anoxybacillus voinovskiensis]GGJ77117.1 hypothetical protein GCM10008982_28080 [Anoxybacillus voinovskiensis]